MALDVTVEHQWAAIPTMASATILSICTRCGLRSLETPDDPRPWLVDSNLDWINTYDVPPCPRTPTY